RPGGRGRRNPVLQRRRRRGEVRQPLRQRRYPAALALQIDRERVSGTSMLGRRLPILMYHKVDELPPGSSDTNYVRPAQFAEQVAALRQWGFEPITFARWLSRDALPPRPIILTFDDGYRDFERNAWPLLKANGCPATVFLV